MLHAAPIVKKIGAKHGRIYPIPPSPDVVFRAEEKIECPTAMKIKFRHRIYDEHPAGRSLIGCGNKKRRNRRIIAAPPQPPK